MSLTVPFDNVSLNVTLELDPLLSSAPPTSVPELTLQAHVISLFKDYRLVFLMAFYILFSRFVSYWFFIFKLPRLVGDLIAGCLFGPTLLSTAVDMLVEQEARQAIRFFGDLGIILSSMNAGLNFDYRVLRGQYLRVAVYTFLNCALPTVLTIPLYYVLPPEWSAEKPAAFFVILAMTMMTTALSFCCLILEELNLLSHSLGKFIIGFSFPSTIVCSTALSIGTALAVDHPFGPVGLIMYRFGGLVVLTICCVSVHMLWNHLIATSKGDWIGAWPTKVTTDLILIIIAGGLVCGMVSAMFDYSHIPGAFLWGACMPFNDGIRRTTVAKVGFITRWIFLPLYFLGVGVSFDLRTMSLNTAPYVLLVAVCGALFKFAIVPLGKLFGLTMRESAFCATLADTRGFTVLVAGVRAMQVGVFNQDMFSACVLMTLLTNFLAGPLGKIFKPGPEDDGSESESDGECDKGPMIPIKESDLEAMDGGPSDRASRPPTDGHPQWLHDMSGGDGGLTGGLASALAARPRARNVGYTLPGEAPLIEPKLDEDKINVVRDTDDGSRIVFAEEVLGRFAYYILYQRGTRDDPLLRGNPPVIISAHRAATLAEQLPVTEGRTCPSGDGPGSQLSQLTAPGGAGGGGGYGSRRTAPSFGPNGPTSFGGGGLGGAAPASIHSARCAGDGTLPRFTGAELIAYMALGVAYTGTNGLDTGKARFATASRALVLGLIAVQPADDGSIGTGVGGPGSGISAPYGSGFGSLINRGPPQPVAPPPGSEIEMAIFSDAPAPARGAIGRPPSFPTGEVSMALGGGAADPFGGRGTAAATEPFCESTWYVVAPHVPLVRPSLTHASNRVLSVGRRLRSRGAPS